MIKCNYCNKELKQGTNCWHIDGDGEDYCYHDIETKKDIYNSCIGKELIRCGYSEEFILNLFNQDLEDREVEIYFTEIYE